MEDQTVIVLVPEQFEVKEESLARRLQSWYCRVLHCTFDRHRSVCRIVRGVFWTECWDCKKILSEAVEVPGKWNLTVIRP